MEIAGLTLSVAFAAGLVSFLSPCVLPLVPGFLAYLAGDAAHGTPSRGQTFKASVFFVIGFSTVFALLGVLLNTLLAFVAYDVQVWLSRIGGVIIMFFGLYLTGLVRIKFLDRPHTLSIKKKFSSRELTSFIFGAAFAIGWTPCVGAALGAILGLATTAPSSAFILLMAYALGLGLPFLLMGAFAGEVSVWLNKVAGVARVFTIFFGILLILLGVLIFTQKLSLLANVESLILLVL